MQYTTNFFCSCSLFWYCYSVINVYNRDQRWKSDFRGTTRRFNHCTRAYSLFYLSSTSFRQETHILGMILFYINFLYVYDSYINILIISSITLCNVNVELCISFIFLILLNIIYEYLSKFQIYIKILYQIAYQNFKLILILILSYLENRHISINNIINISTFFLHVEQKYIILQIDN